MIIGVEPRGRKTFLEGMRVVTVRNAKARGVYERKGEKKGVKEH